MDTETQASIRQARPAQKFSQPEKKTALVEALRSGEFRQGKSRLNRGGEMCCLGVLCELALRDGQPIRVNAYDTTYYDNSSLYPPRSVKEWAGLPLNDVGNPTPAEDGFDVIIELDREVTLYGTMNWEAQAIEPVTYPAGTHVGLGELNDGGLSFEEIADIIERVM